MIQLSPSKLNLLKDCPRCFWWANKNKVPRMRGIFPSLPGGMDIILKKHFDMCRGRGKVPAEIMDRVEGKLFPDQAQLNRWRNWRTGLVYEDLTRGVRLIGALDDCLIDGQYHIPLDYKTKGQKPKDDGSQYYQLQLDMYDLMLSSNGFKTNGKAYLVYVYPQEVLGSTMVARPRDKATIQFGIEVFQLNTDGERAKTTLDVAVRTINGPEPAPGMACDYCNYVESRGRRF